jgi:hypothetical protein
MLNTKAQVMADVRAGGFKQISMRSRPTMISPAKCERAASIQVWSVMVGSSAGTRCDSTSCLDPGGLRNAPACSADVW